jgi:transcriptional regulator with XRE-family HTH domain
LGGQLTIARYKMNLSQRDVAEKIGVTPQIVSQWEKNQTKPAERRLEQLAEIYETRLKAPRPASGDEFADRQEELEHRVSALHFAGKDKKQKASAGNGRNNCVVLSEIYESDLTGDIKDLRDLPELYPFHLPAHALAGVRDPAALRVVQIAQDSLVPVFHPHDWLFVDTTVNKPVLSRGYYVIALDPEGIITRQIEPVRDEQSGETRYRLFTPNAAVPEQLLSKKDVRILGRVIGRLSIKQF